MLLSRREFLRLAGLAAAGATASGCAPFYTRLAGGPAQLAGWPPDAAGDFQALSRLTFGPRVEERRRVAEIGLPAWVEEQLAPATIADRGADWRVRRFDTLTLSANDLADLGDRLFDEVDGSGIVRDLKQATLLRQVFSRRQLYERMVEFWTDHFNISVAKGDCWFLKVVDDREVIRAHALGNFRDLLWASAHSPAMLVYLDNQANHREAPNENYARELMELHTLGVNGGYTQADVMELARCLTGWSVKDHFWRGDFTFDAGRHDPGNKTVLGASIEPAGQREAEQILDHLATHPSTAYHIAVKLVRRFVHDQPEKGAGRLVDRAAATFLRTGGDISAVLRTILLDGLLQREMRPGPKFKRPVDFVVSALRMLDAESDGGDALQTYLAQMGQPTFEWPTPDGPPDDADAWSGNLMPRWKFALALSRNEIPGTRIDLAGILETAAARTPTEVIDQLCHLLLGAPLPAPSRDTLLEALEPASANDPENLPRIIIAGLLASPAFQWR